MVIDRKPSLADCLVSILIAVAAAALVATSAQAASPILFLDDCSTGCAYTPGAEDSRINRSSILSQSVVVPAYPFGSSSFQQVVECVRTTFAPFDVDVTDVDPGTAVHLEIAIGGLSQDLGFQPGITTIGPFSCNVDVDTASRTGFTFPVLFGDDPAAICGVSALTVGSMLGLDYEILEGDVMSSQAGSYPRAFLDQAAPCGEFSERQCACGGPTQNSFQQLLVILPEPGSAMTIAALGVLVALGGTRRLRRNACVCENSSRDPSRDDTATRVRDPGTRSRRDGTHRHRQHNDPEAVLPTPLP